MSVENGVTKEMRDKMLSQRIKYAMCHLSRREHTALLARPNWRRLLRIDLNVPTADPFRVRRAALRSRASKRIRVMARPKFVTKKYDPAVAPPPYPRINPKTLTPKENRRIVDLALPKKRVLLDRMKLVVIRNAKATMNELLAKVRKSRYQRYRVFCNARQEREARKKKKLMAKLRKALVKPEDWRRHAKILEKLAAPKVVAKRPRRKPSKRKKWRPVNVERLETLALPRTRAPPPIRDPFTVAPRALTYKISKRIVEIAFHKTPPKILLRTPGAVRRGALKATASERIVALATPAKRPPGRETDLREDAFIVSPTALKAKCSKRIKILARPKIPPKPVVVKEPTKSKKRKS